ncbi:MAG TPA: DNA replication/repair protein RecF [Woeseiaceae bacterium]|nr:DNA replication/repair protein RecF [Woeseiaceae bacterium]
MTLRLFRAQDFRCFAKVELEPDSRYNLVHGENASGKTSLLEALAYLGRGKSFRGAPTSSLIRHGVSEFLLFGRSGTDQHLAALGVRNSRDGLEVKVDGVSGLGASALAEALPLQLVDPEVHELVSGGPEGRRRYLDWVAFHVEHKFLDEWRRFRRALKQRNAALRAGHDVAAWSRELVDLGGRVDEIRLRVMERLVPGLVERSTQLLGSDFGFEYRRGWSAEKTLGEAVDDSYDRDLQLGSSQVGPHRADLVLVQNERQAKRLVSRGQQKLLACSMILAATALVQEHLGRPMLLLLDDPAAELDRRALARLLRAVFALDCQVIATALEPGSLEFPAEPAVFHVKQGVLTRQ